MIRVYKATPKGPKLIRRVWFGRKTFRYKGHRYAIAPENVYEFGVLMQVPG